MCMQGAGPSNGRQKLLAEERKRGGDGQLDVGMDCGDGERKVRREGRCLDID